jgi:hypothetical protein
MPPVKIIVGHGTPKVGILDTPMLSRVDRRRHQRVPDEPHATGAHALRQGANDKRLARLPPRRTPRPAEGTAPANSPCGLVEAGKEPNVVRHRGLGPVRGGEGTSIPRGQITEDAQPASVM